MCACVCMRSARFIEADTVSLERNTFLLRSFACKSVSDSAFLSAFSFLDPLYASSRRHMRRDTHTHTLMPGFSKYRLNDFVYYYELSAVTWLNIHSKTHSLTIGTLPFELYVDHYVLNQSRNSHSAIIYDTIWNAENTESDHRKRGIIFDPFCMSLRGPFRKIKVIRLDCFSYKNEDVAVFGLRLYSYNLLHTMN